MFFSVMSTTQLQYEEMHIGLLQVLYVTSHFTTALYTLDGIREQFD